MAFDSTLEQLNFFNLSATDRDYRTIAAVVRKQGEKSLNGFYGKIFRTAQIAQLFSTDQQAERAKRAQLNHWDKMFSDGLDDAYIARADTIGQVHARIGLEPKWYIGGYACILSDLIASMIAGGSRALVPGNAILAKRIGKLIRVAMFDMSIALATYFDKAEEHVRAAIVDKIDDALEALSRGDLTTSVQNLPAGYEALERHFNDAIGRLNETLRAVSNGTHAINSSANEIRAASDDLARRTEEQASSLEESSSALSQINALAQRATIDIGDLNLSVNRVHKDAMNGSDVVRSAVLAMSDIQQSAQSIARIIEVIDSIAFQTNLLALNAGVEAARVGAEGQGFAVVANEVRALAQRSAEAAEEIKSLVGKSLDHVESGVELVGNAGSVLDSILSQISDINGAADRIAATAEDQSTNLTQIHGSVTEMDRMTQQNAAMVEQSNAAARTMAQEVDRLAHVVGTFRIDAQPAKAPLARAA